jgi:hypothetical protein
VSLNYLDTPPDDYPRAGVDGVEHSTRFFVVNYRGDSCKRCGQVHKYLTKKCVPATFLLYQAQLFSLAGAKIERVTK